MRITTGILQGWLAILLYLGISSFPSMAGPRRPLPPWPQKTSAVFGFNNVDGYAPFGLMAIGEESAVRLESWSGYSLVRDGLSMAPVVVPALGVGGSTNVAVAHGAVSFWMCPDWTTKGAADGAEGPGHYARLLELVSLAGAPAVRWSLYLNEAGDTIFFSGLSNNGATDFLQAPIEFHAGAWTLFLLCYGPDGSALFANGELLATGSGVAAPSVAAANDLGLVVGSTISSTYSAISQFEELILFDYWPSAARHAAYFSGVIGQVERGPIGEQEQAAWQELVA